VTEPARTDDRARRLTLAATVLGSSLAFVDATVVVVALPTIQHDLHFSLVGEQWVFLAYSLALASLYLPAGAIGDRRGRRETFVAGVVGFALASMLAGLAPSGGVLLAARVVQGVAAAFVTTNSLALLRETYGDEAGRAVGLWTAFTSVATLAGPPLGGVLVEWVSWRWIFFINLPLAAAAVVLAHKGRCAKRAEHRVGRLDVPGSVLVALAFGMLTYGMVQGAANGFGSVWWSFAVAAAAAAAFVVVERRSAEPLLPFELFRRRNFAFANLETLVVYGALGGFFFFYTIYLQFLGFTPTEAGLAQVPASVMMILLSPRFGRIADQRGPRVLLTTGPVLVAAGFVLFSFMRSTADFWRFGVPGLLLFSVGLSMVVAPITATALSSAPERFSGIASGLNQTVARLGSLLTVAVLGLVVLLVYRSSGGSSGVPLARGQHDEVLRAASMDAFHIAALVSAGLALCAAAVGAFGISDSDARRKCDTGELVQPSPAQ
jgi:EmrB/QacA subfamily drug resistance transporter